jgi:DNA polymerase zeta
MFATTATCRRRAPPRPRAALRSRTHSTLQDVLGAASFARQLGLALEQALRRYAAERREPPRRHHVSSVMLLKARPFYGYHEDDELFVRVDLLNPGEVTRAAALLQRKAVFDRAFAVHEAHVPFILQAMMDLNVAGMSLLALPAQRVVFRGELPDEPRCHQRVQAVNGLDASGEAALAFGAAEVVPTPEGGSGASVGTPGPQVRPSLLLISARFVHVLTPPAQVWTRACAASGRALCNRGMARQTTCELEADALFVDVLNRAEVLRVPLADATPDMQLMQSLAPLWAEERLRAAAAGLPLPRRGSSPERAPHAAESDAVQRARAAIRCGAARCEWVYACADDAALQGRC